MGIIRKLTSVSTLGAVDFRSDKERIAKNTRKTREAVERSHDLAERRLQLEEERLELDRSRVAPDQTDSGTPANASLTDQLRELANLHRDGVLDDEEFGAAKRRLLD